ncbi:MAG TPA: tetratricopeptide repeat protein [Reyranella sp.]|jgi:predicted Zn-dependent protease|nr:tetratricopeptide repeat protein [Reyranella sp.]
MRPILLSLAAALAVSASGPVLAMGNSSDTPTPAAASVDPNYTKAKAMIEAKDYKGALPLLQQVVAKNSKNADAYNLMGYATRKSGDPNGALQYYNTALGLDPKHLGAHEYVGEAYLQLGKLDQAEQELARLDALCVFGCLEQRTLKAAIADYKAGKKPTN